MPRNGPRSSSSPVPVAEGPDASAPVPVVGTVTHAGASGCEESGERGERGETGARLRLRYSKLGPVRFTSHRDVVRMWERATRRSGLPVAWSAGFSPRPLLSFGLALPTGAESIAEYLDMALRPDGSGLEHRPPPLTPAAPDLATLLSDLLPDGVDVAAVGALPERSGSLQQEVSSCSWNLEVLGLAAGELTSRVERLLAAPSVLVERERKGRSVRDDLRPAVLGLGVIEPPAHPVATGDHGRPSVWLEAELATRPRGVRPGELLGGLGQEVRLVRACRMHQWIEREGARSEPLAVCGGEPGVLRTPAGGRAI